MNKVILPKQKAITIFLVFALGYYISNLLRAITATISPNLISEFNLSAGDLGLLGGGYFIGSPAMNLFETEASSNNSVKINDTLIKTSTDLSRLKDKKIKLGIRSEFIKISKDQKENVISANVEKVEDLGNYKLLTAKIGNLTIKSKISRETEVPLDKVSLYIPEDKCCVYEDEKLI